MSWFMSWAQYRMTTRTFKQAKLSLEELEERTLPSGNAIVQENLLAGTSQSVWDINGSGDANIQGFATDISVNQGQTVNFKINTDSKQYHLDIYRMGYYGGAGAAKKATINVQLAQAQVQPNAFVDSTTHLYDAGNWNVSASWNVPVNAVSGIYFAKLVRDDGTAGSSHIVFIVRNDSSHSNLLFQTSDETWEAYNTYGGFNLYNGGRKVSYNRPFNTRTVSDTSTWVFSNEYPMVRWLEANGYDVSYFTDVDSDRNGSLI
jgi:hypothetical protein